MRAERAHGPTGGSFLTKKVLYQAPGFFDLPLAALARGPQECSVSCRQGPLFLTFCIEPESGCSGWRSLSPGGRQQRGPREATPRAQAS